MEVLPRTPPPRGRPAAARPQRIQKHHHHHQNRDRPADDDATLHTETKNTTTPSNTALQTPSRQVEVCSGIEDTPSQPSNGGKAPFYCPICMLHFPLVLKSICCSQLICGGCARGLFVQRGFLDPSPSTHQLAPLTSAPHHSRSGTGSTNTTPRPGSMSLAHILSATPTHPSQLNRRPLSNDSDSGHNQHTIASVRSIITAVAERPVVPCPYCSRTLRAVVQLPPVIITKEGALPHDVISALETPRRPQPDIAVTPLSHQNAAHVTMTTPSHQLTGQRTPLRGAVLPHRGGASPYNPLVSRSIAVLPPRTPASNVLTANIDAAPTTKFAEIKALPIPSTSSPVVGRFPVSAVPQQTTSVGASFEELRAQLVRFQLSHDYRPVQESEVKNDPDRKKQQELLQQRDLAPSARPDYAVGPARTNRPGRNRRLNPAAAASVRIATSSSSDAALRRQHSPAGSNNEHNQEEVVLSESSSWCPIM